MLHPNRITDELEVWKGIANFLYTALHMELPAKYRFVYIFVPREKALVVSQDGKIRTERWKGTENDLLFHAKEYCCRWLTISPSEMSGEQYFESCGERWFFRFTFADRKLVVQHEPFEKSA